MADTIGRPVKRRRRNSGSPAASLLRGIDPARLNANGRAILAQAIRENRPASANAVPGLASAVRALVGATRGQSKVPRSARPIGPIAQAQSVVASLVNQSEAAQALRAALPARPTRRMGPPQPKGPFKTAVRLDPSQVSDQRRNTPTERRAAAPRRSGASSSTSRGPSPNPMARKRANANARFQRPS